jgi:hypothetical protein
MKMRKKEYPFRLQPKAQFNELRRRRKAVKRSFNPNGAKSLYRTPVHREGDQDATRLAMNFGAVLLEGNRVHLHGFLAAPAVPLTTMNYFVELQVATGHAEGSEPHRVLCRVTSYWALQSLDVGARVLVEGYLHTLDGEMRVMASNVELLDGPGKQSGATDGRGTA